MKTQGGLGPISLADAMPAAGRIAQNSYFEQWLRVFFARRGELGSNRREDQEISMLSLHLL